MANSEGAKIVVFLKKAVRWCKKPYLCGFEQRRLFAPHTFLQKYALKDFEFSINPATWKAGETLAQRGAVKSLRELERHFWAALVEDEEAQYEVETIITPTRVKAYTCECWDDNRRFMCPHIVATLVKLRQYLAQSKSSAPAPQPPKSEILHRLTVPQVLERTTEPELREFVRHYAGQDRDFAVALKIWFAASATDAENPFAQVLQSVVPKSPKSLAALSGSNLRRMVKTLEDLQDRLKSAQGAGNRRLQFQIGAALLQKLLPLVMDGGEHRPHAALDEPIQNAFDALHNLWVLGSLPPELNDALWQQLADFGTRALYPPELTKEAIRLLGEACAADAAKRAALEAVVAETAPPYPLFLACWQGYTFARRGDAAGLQGLLDVCRPYPALLKNTLTALYYAGQGKALLEPGKQLLEAGIFNDAQRREIADILFLIAEKTGDKTYQTQYFHRKFVQTGRAEWLHKAQQLLGPRWKSARQNLLNDLRAKGLIAGIATLYAEEGLWEPLCGLLESEGNLELLQSVESALLPVRPDFVGDQYVAALSVHLEGHFGRPASLFVREKLAPLLLKGQTALVRTIQQRLVAAFPEHQTLEEILEELFINGKWKAKT